MWFLSRLVVSLTVRRKNLVDRWSRFMWMEWLKTLIIQSKRQNPYVIWLLSGTCGSSTSPRCKTWVPLKQQLTFDLLSYCWLWQNLQYTHYSLLFYLFRMLEGNWMVSCGFERESSFLIGLKKSWSYVNSELPTASYERHVFKQQKKLPGGCWLKLGWRTPLGCWCWSR